MPDSANFNEVYQLTVDTATFKQGLDQLVQIYQQFITSLGDQAQGILAVSLFKGLQEQIAQFATQVAELTSINKEVVYTAAEQIEASLATIDAKEEALAQKRAERAKKAAEDEVAASQGGNIPPGAARNKAIDQQSIADTSASMDEANDAKRVRAGEEQEAAYVQAKAYDDQLTTQKIANADKVAAAQQAALDKQEAAAEANDAKRIRAGEEVEAAQAAAIAENQKRQEAADESWLGNLAEGAARIAKIYVTWQLVNALFEAMAALIMAPIKAFEAGFQYINQLEIQADKLTGTLATNLQFSKDLSTNFQMAASSAKDVAVALQQLAINLNVPLETVERVFSAITSSGGAQTVKTLGDMVTLTQQFVAAFVAAGRNADTLRSLITQLPQLFEGNVKSTNAIAEALGVSGTQLHDIIASAKTQKDLTEQLTPLLQGQMAAVGATADHYRDLEASLKLQVSEIEGAAALPLYEQLSELLRTNNGYLKDNTDQIKQWATLIGQSLASVIQVAQNLSSAASSGSSLVNVFTPLVSLFNNLIGFTNIWLATLVTGFNATRNVVSILNDPLNSNNTAEALANITQGLKNYKSALDTIDTNNENVAAKLRSLQPGFVGPTQGGSNSLGQTVTQGKKLPNLGPADTGAEQKAKLQEQLASTKDYYEQLNAAVKAGEDSLAVSKREGAALSETLAENEEATLNKYINEYEAYINKNVADVKKRNELIAAAESERSNLTKGINQRSDTAGQAGDTEASNAALEKLKGDLALQKQAVTEEAAYESQLVGQGYQTQIQALEQKEEAETAAYNISRTQLTDELSKIDSQTVKYQTLTNQIKALDQAHEASGHQHALTGSGLDEQSAQADRALVISQATAADTAKTALLNLDDTTKGYSANLNELNAIQREDLALKTQEVALQLALAEAKKKDSQETKTLTAQLAQLNAQQVQLVASQVSSIYKSGNPQGVNQVNATATVNNAKDQEQNTLFSGNESVDQFNQHMNALDAILQTFTPTLSDAFSQFSQKLTGFDLPTAWSNATTSSQKATVATDALAGALQNLPGIINTIEQGMKSGGVLGGVGAGASAFSGTIGSLVSGLGGNGTLVGGIVSAVGGIASLIGSIFTAQAKKIADDLKTAFSATVQAFQDGTSTLVQTIAAVETERNQAVSQLSGQKGGQDQLNTLLPQFDQEIAQLKQQQQQVTTNFEQSLGVLQLQSDTLGTIVTQWQSINKQVTDYINAGGDVTKAQQFLSLSLQQLQVTTQDQLNQANQTAISDAQNLNSLLQQKIDLTTQWQQQEFSLVNQDSLERREDGSVANGEQLAAAEVQYQQQLDALNNQISLTQQKVTLEGQIFNISGDTAALNEQSNALTIQQLNEQIAQWTSLKQIIADITENGAGVFTGTGVLSQIASLTPVAPMTQINVTVTVPPGTTDPTGFGNTVGDSVAQAIQSKLANGQ